MLRLLILETDVTDKLVNIFKAKRTNHATLVCVFTRDDVVSQRLKFGSAFLSSSWESKIALFF